MTSHLSYMSTQSASIFPPLTPCHFSLSTTPPRNIPSPPLRLSRRGSLVLRATNDKAPLNPIPFHKRTFKFKSLMGQLTRPCFLEPAGFSLVGGLKSSTLGLQRTLDETSSTFLRQVKTFIQMRTILKVADNSGAKLIMCIQPLKPKKGGARLGDTIVASVKESQPGVNVKKGVKVKTGVKDFQPGGKVKKGDVVYAVVVRAAMPKGRCDGSEVKFDDNAAVLINKKGEPIGTRVFGPVPHELRLKKHVKILCLAEHIV